MAHDSTPAISSSRKFTFKLEFVDSAGLRWRFIQNTIDFLDMLLQRRFKEALEQSSEEVKGPSGAMLGKTVVVDVHSKVVEICNDLFQQNNGTNVKRTRYCAVMEATISTRTYLDTVLNLKSYLNLLDFMVYRNIQTYMNDQYPIFVDQLNLTYMAPQWLSTNKLALTITGAIETEIDIGEEDSFSKAFLEFISASPGKPSLDSHMVINEQRVFDGFDTMKQGYSTTLQVQVTFFQPVQPHVNWSEFGSVPTSDTYQRRILYRFRAGRETLLQDYLWASNHFFRDFHTVQADVFRDSAEATSSAPLPIATPAPNVDVFAARFKEPEGPRSFTAVTATLILVFLLVLALAGIIVYYLRRRKKSQ